MPDPWQTGQVRGWVPGFAPSPLQVSQTPGARRREGRRDDSIKPLPVTIFHTKQIED